jgi:hypothetical protein
MDKEKEVELKGCCSCKAHYSKWSPIMTEAHWRVVVNADLPPAITQWLFEGLKAIKDCNCQPTEQLERLEERKMWSDNKKELWESIELIWEFVNEHCHLPNQESLLPEPKIYAEEIIKALSQRFGTEKIKHKPITFENGSSICSNECLICYPESKEKP